MHEVGLLEHRVLAIDSGRVRARLNVVLQVPAQVLVHHGEHEEHVLVHIVPDGLGLIRLLQGSYRQGEIVSSSPAREKTSCVCIPPTVQEQRRRGAESHRVCFAPVLQLSTVIEGLRRSVCCYH